MVEGECLPSHAKVVDRVEANPPTVPCDEPHRYEVFAVGRLNDGAYPGAEETDAAARQLCYEQFAPNVGFDASQMGDDIRVVVIPPSEQSWNNQADRDVECLLIFTEDRNERVAQPRAAS